MAKRVILGLVCALAAATLRAGTFTVSNTNDSGAGSLRQAILDSNTNGSAVTDTIQFSIGSAGPHTILVPNTALPQITTPVIIDGYTQPGASANTLPFAGGTNAVLMIAIDGDSETRDNDDVPFVNCLDFAATATDSVVRGLAIGQCNVGILSAARMVIEGNFIGVEPNGTAGFPNTQGVLILGVTGARVGGTTVAAMNVVSWNDLGVHVDSSTATRVEGNLIGTTRTGTAALGNSGEGVFIIASNGTVVDHNVISGQARNIQSVGVELSGDATSNELTANLIGVGADGTTPVPNNTGILFTEYGSKAPAGNWIGLVGKGNVIAHSTFDGLSIKNTAPAAVRNSIRYNSFFDNGATDVLHQHLSIDLDDDGVTSNDTGDVDHSANERQNFPFITVATQAAGGAITVTGTLDTLPSQSFVIQVHHGTTCQSSGFGDGVYAAEATVTTNAAGHATFSIVTPALSSGGIVSTTATDSVGNTSEFSPCVAVTTAAASPVALTLTKQGPATAATNTNVTYTLTATNQGVTTATGATITDALPAGLTFVSATPSQGSCTGTTTITCTLGTLAPAASATVTLVATTPSTAQTITNTATLTSTEPDVTPINNTASATTAVSNVTSVPTLGTSALAALALMLAAFALVRLR